MDSSSRASFEHLTADGYRGNSYLSNAANDMTTCSVAGGADHPRGLPVSAARNKPDGSQLSSSCCSKCQHRFVSWRGVTGCMLYWVLSCLQCFEAGQPAGAFIISSSLGHGTSQLLRHSLRGLTVTAVSSLTNDCATLYAHLACNAASLARCCCSTKPA